MFLLGNGLLNGGTISPIPKMLLIMLSWNFLVLLKALLTLLLMTKLKLWLSPPIQAAMP